MAKTDLQSRPAVEDQAVVEDKKKQLREAAEAKMEDERKMMAEEDEEVDETFLALQKLLRALNGSRANVVVPMGAPARSGPSAANTQEANAPQSPEELLETRRQERERFRSSLMSAKDNQRYPTYYYYEEDEDEEEPSVESQISNRVISGSFSRLNVHIISRERWSTEEAERLPLVLLPKDGKVVSPAENPKLNIIFSREHEELRDQLVAALDKLDSENSSEQTRLLTPPQSTWTIQMRHFDSVASH
ncbi:hypothetical protein Poli38472_000664 [Pythium oligandrum]|uniref:Uncharacterized protein n=1 Tax=Pythium oligandrum TaxID=41045 RepID=A0A8K1CCC3_PYTOL|nr:hypothetical protein Poli38472_000664 [Pythium oligandrum]|eukprot:TMW60622.1 hypothetical protein Poli38472_000664 [Pythium oligandrum]